MHVYPEVTISAESNGDLVIRAPWMESTISNWMDLSLSTSSQVLSSDQIAAILSDKLFRYPHIRKLPYWIMPPRSVEELGGPKAISPKDLACLEEFLTKVESTMTISGDFWDLAPILESSQLLCSHLKREKLFDPLSAYSLTQRLILIESRQQSELGFRLKELLSRTSPSDKEASLNYLYDCVAISRMTTSQVRRILSPVCSYPGQAGQLMQAYLAAEKGHEQFAINSLKFMTDGKFICRVVEEPKDLTLLLNLLFVAAQTSPLGLALCLFCFEGLTYDHPMTETWTPWQVLGAMDPRHAHLGVGRHSRLNHDERHGEVGFDLASVLPAQTFEDVCVAVRLAEICVKLRLRLFSDLIKVRLDFGNHISCY